MLAKAGDCLLRSGRFFTALSIKQDVIIISCTILHLTVLFFIAPAIREHRTAQYRASRPIDEKKKTFTASSLRI